ncbi:hypothetical protein pEaSNUABM34_00254 [Erwinia phage pEa_SNUABM_34]|nr:hypothetical protein pEaSNUABM34_00254 [Erwinia phage pEa_SNUABM_34]QYW05268.1 hypothetical protein pEaSNUABM21_00254 [Erwinia phage pEa_SNUABM_21]
MNASTFDFSIICTESFNINELNKIAVELNKLITNSQIKIEAVEIDDEGAECILLAVGLDEDGEETGDNGYSLHLDNGDYQIVYLGVPHPDFDKHELATSDFELFIKSVNGLEF